MKTNSVLPSAIVWIVSLLALTYSGCKNIESHDPPVAKMRVSSTSAEAPTTITFTDESAGDITLRRWDLHDGSSATAQQVELKFMQAGRYVTRLTVSGPGGTSTVSETVNITVPQPSVTLSDLKCTYSNSGQTVTLKVDAVFKNFAKQSKVLGLYWLRKTGSVYYFQSTSSSTNAPGKTLGLLRVMTPSSNSATFDDLSATWTYSSFPVRTSGTTYYGYAVVYDRVSISSVTSVTSPSLAQIGPPSAIASITFQ